VASQQRSRPPQRGAFAQPVARIRQDKKRLDEEPHRQISHQLAMDEVAEARRISKSHKKWIIALLKEQGEEKEFTCTYDVIVQKGEEMHCDTVGAMLKMLKKAKVIQFDQMFLMYPMHKDETVTLINMDFDPDQEA
jgi:hypothetical protein